MDDDAERLKKYYEKLSDAELQENKKAMGPGSLDGQIITEILAKRLALPEKHFKETYNQSERHHRDLTRSARNAAVISVIGALAAWASVLFQYAQTRSGLNESRQPAASVTPTPSPP